MRRPDTTPLLSVLFCASISCAVEEATPYSPRLREIHELCGNGTVDPAVGEICDGEALGDATCMDYGRIGGLLKCSVDCRAHDVTECLTEPVCGDGERMGAERCDGEDLAGNSCQTLGFLGGVLACAENCRSFDADGCSNDCIPECGDRVCGRDPQCGESCGTCEDGLCTADGQCIVDCAPQCWGRECGPDPICNVPCGECAAGPCNEEDGICSATTENGMTIQVSWTTAADLDLFVARGDTPLCADDSCYSFTCSDPTRPTHPDWDLAPGFSVGDPVFAAHTAGASSVAAVSIEGPVNGAYPFAVHFAGGSSNTEPTGAVVRVLVYGEVVHEETRELRRGDLWLVGTVDWSGSSGTFERTGLLQFNFTCVSDSVCLIDSQCSAAPWPDGEYCDLSLTGGRCTPGCRNDASCLGDDVCNPDHDCVDPATLPGWGESCLIEQACQPGLECDWLIAVCDEKCDAPGAECGVDADCCPLTGARYCVEDLFAWGYCSD